MILLVICQFITTKNESYQPKINILENLKQD